MTPEQSRAARGLIGWSVRQLAEKAGVGVNTVSRFENSGEALLSTAAKMQSALEEAGVQFIGAETPSPTGGPGVRLKGSE